MSELLSVRTAQQCILDAFPAPRVVEKSLRDLYHQVLASAIFAPIDLPPFANSSMDGFAVHSSDVAGASDASPVELPVTQDIPAGISPHALSRGGAARIMTGAPLPPGADTVIPIEQTDAYPAKQAAPLRSVKIFAPARPGEYVRPQGQDIQKGSPVFPAGHALSPQDVGLLASLGYTKAAIFARPKIAIFSSGDELSQPGNPLTPGKIYDANQFTLTGLLEDAGAQVISLGTLPDDPGAIAAVLSEAAKERPDLLLSSAGVSVGAHDYIKHVIESQGTLTFWRVDMRPGKPLAFGAFQDIPFIGLPGNPVSAFVGCLVFVLPVVRKFRGLDPLSRHTVQAVLSEEVTSDGRESYLRAYLTDTGQGFIVSLKGHQGSGNLYALSQANALLILSSGVKSLPAGETAQVWQL